MTHRFARLPRLAFSLLLALPLFAQEPWDAPAFSSEPKALLAAAAKVPAGEEGMVVLLDESFESFEADGTKRTVARLMYRIDEESAVASNATVAALWAPWFDQRPVVAARVITKDGTVHMLDPKAITEAPARETSLDIFSDNRVVRAPLPAVAIGSVVEYTITTEGRSPIEGAGTGSVFVFGQWVPVERSRLVIEGPSSIEPRIVNRADIQPVIEEAGGRRRITFTTGRLAAFEHLEDHVPFDEAAYPYIAFATGTSWQDIAARYAKIVDEQIAGSDLEKLVKRAIGNAKTPREIAARVLASIQKDIRYAGVEVAEGSIIPRPPATVLKNKYGDCKDKATLLVAMLREVGLTAHVALLRAGDDLDAHPELPSMRRFNHAIVRVMDGSEEIWIDPTDEFARAGELPIADQGRMALIADAGTTSLTRTPELPSSANRYTEIRTFNLGEHGKAPVVEVTEAWGPSDAEQRRDYATTAAEKYRERMERYVKSYYFAKALEGLEATAARDLESPFKLTLKVKESGSGIVQDGQATVAVHPGALFNSLPDELRNWSEPQPDDDPDDRPKPRVRDFVFPQPLVKELTSRIVPPAGYVARTLPDAQNRKLGTTTYTSEYSIADDGSVIARLRFDSGKRRITAKEYEQTRVAISKLIDEPQINIGFELIAQTKLAAGDVAGALVELRRLAALHPKEAQHHIEISSALLAGGLGEPAREEARLAVKIEPKNARAHLALARALMHDLLGRQLRKGSDLEGAIASLRKAKELDPENLIVRIELARLLRYGTDGFEFGTGAKLAESADEYRAMTKDFGDDGRAYEGELMMTLAHLARFNELKELSETAENAQRRNVGRLIAIAATEGTDAAMRELGKFALDTRRTYAAELGQHMMNLRYYPEAAAALALSTQGKAEEAGSAVLIEALRKTKRLETVELRADDPSSTFPRLIAAFLTGKTEEMLKLIAPEVRDRVRQDMEEEDRSSLGAMQSAIGGTGMRPAVTADLVHSLLQVNKDGDDETGYRLRHRMPAIDEPMIAYVSKQDGKFFLHAADDDESLGIAALQFAESGQVDRARTWLNWAREGVNGGAGDDPLSRPPFAMVWPKAKPAATADEIRLAAALQIAEHSDEKVDLLLELREKAASDDTKLAIDVALVKAYGHEKRFAESLPVARRLFEAQPDSARAFVAFATALAHTGAHDEAAALAKKRLERYPNDRDALRELAQNAAASRDYAAAVTYAQQVLDDTIPEPDDFNNAAWYSLLSGNLERGIKYALQAVDDKEAKDGFALHTLASIYAEADKPLQAREALLKSMEQRSRDQPNADDWYILGRIAETYGVRDAAMAAYKRVPKEKGKEFNADIADLVARRVAKLK